MYVCMYVCMHISIWESKIWYENGQIISSIVLANKGEYLIYFGRFIKKVVIIIIFRKKIEKDQYPRITATLPTGYIYTVDYLFGRIWL